MSFFHEYPYLNLNDMNLDWILKNMKIFISALEELNDWKEEHEEQYQQLKDLYDQIMSGNFPPSVTAAFEKWMKENAIDLVGSLVKQVYFGLTDTGYFVAYIPESWDDIIFNTTGWDIELGGVPDYGHLILSY